MAELPPLELLVQRVERLLERLDELQAINADQAHSLIALTQERDAMRHRLDTARQQLDALIEQLPPDIDDPMDSDAAQPDKDDHEAN